MKVALRELVGATEVASRSNPQSNGMQPFRLDCGDGRTLHIFDARRGQQGGLIGRPCPIKVSAGVSNILPGDSAETRPRATGAVPREGCRPQLPQAGR